PRQLHHRRALRRRHAGGAWRDGRGGRGLRDAQHGQRHPLPPGRPEGARMSGLHAWLTDPSPASRRQAKLGQSYLAWLRIRRNRLAMAGLVIVGLLLLVAAFAPLIAPHDPLVQDLSRRLLPPGTPGNLLGTDDFGRDILSRILYGARITLYI